MSHLPDDLARKTSVIKPSLTVFRGLGQPFIENFPALWIIRGFAFAWNKVLGFEGATPSVDGRRLDRAAPSHDPE
jgi:hypothetical protein